MEVSKNMTYIQNTHRFRVFKMTFTDKLKHIRINRPTKGGKEKSPSDGHCQYQKVMDDHLLACQQIFEREPHSDLLC
jgi:hypothetical protein